MKTYNFVFYNDVGKKVYQAIARKIDITDLQTIVYLLAPAGCTNSEKYTSRLIQTIDSVNLCDGVATVYYVNGSYCVISKSKVID